MLAECPVAPTSAPKYCWPVVSILLREYYDPIYAHQRQLKQERIAFCGELAAVVAYLQDRSRT